MTRGEAFNPFRNGGAAGSQHDGAAAAVGGGGGGKRVPLHQRRREQAQMNQMTSFPSGGDETEKQVVDEQILWPTGWDDGFGDMGFATHLDPWEQPGLVETSFDSSAAASPERPKAALNVSFDTFFTATDVWEQDDIGRNRPQDQAQDVNFTSISAREDDQYTNAEAYFPTTVSPDNLDTVQVSLNERLSILFDDLSAEPSCTIIGSIYVEPSKTIQSPVYLTFRDRRGLVERWEAEGSVCKNVTAAYPHVASLEQGDQIFRLETVSDPKKLQAPIAAYTCLPKLRPVPMLLKTKLQRIKDGCRVGVRIRANPSNTYTLRRIGVVVAVPPDISGEKITTKPDSGQWDDLKRILSWSVEALKPGESIDLQAFFETGNGNQQITSKSPVLVRCDCKTLYSRVEVVGESVDTATPSVRVQVSKSARVLYRKV